MTHDAMVDREMAGDGGPAAPPRRNGELVFNAPWEGRAFGMALALRRRRPYPWEDFRALLERRIAEAGPADDGTRYYEHWVGAFEQLLTSRGLVDAQELEARTSEYLNGERDEVF